MKPAQIMMISAILISFAIGAILNPSAPEQIPTHWNAQGVVDGYSGKTFGLFLLPLIMAGIFILYLVIPSIDPMKKNISEFRQYFDWFMAAVVLFMLYIFGLTLFWTYGYTFNMNYMIIPAISILIYLSGVMMQRAKQNWFIGIRTPWTLSSEKVWDETHKLGAILFKVSAAIGLAGIFFGSYAFLFLIIPLILSSAAAIIYSYLAYRRL